MNLFKEVEEQSDSASSDSVVNDEAKDDGKGVRSIASSECSDWTKNLLG